MAAPATAAQIAQIASGFESTTVLWIFSSDKFILTFSQVKVKTSLVYSFDHRQGVQHIRHSNPTTPE